MNTFKPVERVRSAVDPKPFFEFFAKLIPDAEDREILLSWMASMVQNPGVKFQWAVVLQGTEGNGKSLLLRCLSEAVGIHLTHLPNPEDMNEKYNGYISNNLLIGVEEIHMNGRRDMMDRLKKYITNPRVEIRSMGVDKFMADNLTNWMFLTNYKNAVLKTVNDRRYAIFFTGQQSAEDLERDGMGGSYFRDLWDWCRDGGFEAVATALDEMLINPAYDPAKDCNRAPKTSSTAEAIIESYGRLEQVILDCIEEEQQGFRGGWISSIKLKEVLDKEHLGGMSNNVIADALRTLGYEKFDGYANGRSTAIFNENNRRPTLYVLKEMNGQGIIGNTQYTKAQGYDL